MNKKLWYFQQLNLFKGLPAESLARIESCFDMKKYNEQELVYQAGTANMVFIVKTGQVEIYQISASGKKIIVDRLDPGSIFGDLDVGDDESFFVQATMHSYICFVEKNRFFTMISQYPKQAEQLLSQLFARLIQTERQLISAKSDTVLQRFVKLLLHLGVTKKDQEMIVKEKYTHEELGQMLGVTRQTISTLVNQLEKQQLIQRDNKTIHFNLQKIRAAMELA
ncbi:MAG: Crp/Fnr family transcriptional regulator [Patescibacteria group bacterium]